MAKIFIEETTLTAIGDAIREKEGSSALVPVNDMASRISAISGGGGGGSEPVIEALEITSNGTYTATNCDGYSPITVNVPQDGAPPEEAFILSGDCSYRFASDGWNWFIDNYANRIRTVNISEMKYMFYSSSKLEQIPFEINYGATYSYAIDLKHMFWYCTKLKALPKINNVKPSDMSSMFYSCRNLREIPATFSENWDWSGFSGYMGELCNGCWSLRKIPIELISHLYSSARYSNSYLYKGFTECYALDEAVNLPISGYTANWTSNAFNSCFNNCWRLKRLTFETNIDGTPLVKNWKNQTLDLSVNIGYESTLYDITTESGRQAHAQSSNMLLNNSGITADKLVYDDASYQALKNDPDWFTAICSYTSPPADYSRYNHDSAVETINSLPDTSAYGTNTIKFKGDAGAKTDGGAINTLTEEEIAVATAKGWTVTFV